MKCENGSLVGIIGAMRVEIDGLRALLTDATAEVISGIEFVSGKLGRTRVVCAVCGVGKVFAALCAQTMILRYHPDCIINTGVAGTLTERLSIGQIAVATDVVQHDMDTHVLGDPVGLISGLDMVHIPADAALSTALEETARKLGLITLAGTVASGDEFICDSAKKAWIAETFGGIVCEMEGAAIGQVCYVNGVPFAVLRAVSDGGDENSHMDFPTFARMAAENSIRALREFLQ